MENKEELLASLTHWVAAEKLDARLVVPVLQELSSGPARAMPLLTILEAIEEEMTEAAAALSTHVLDSLRQEALRAYQERMYGRTLSGPARGVLEGLDAEPPAAWRLPSDLTSTLQIALRTARDLDFIGGNQHELPQLFKVVQTRSEERLDEAYAAVVRRLECQSEVHLRQLEQAWPEMPAQESVLNQIRTWMATFQSAACVRASACLGERTDEAQAELIDPLTALQARFLAATDREEKKRILDCICAWSSPAAVPILQSITTDTWAQNRALLNLTLRFGQSGLRTWEDWVQWLNEQARLWKSQDDNWSHLIQNYPEGLFLILYSQAAEAEPEAIAALRQKSWRTLPPLDVTELVRFWARWAPVHEQRALLEMTTPAAGIGLPPVIDATKPGAEQVAQFQPPPLPVLRSEPRETIARSTATAPAPLPAAAPSPPPEPSAWQKHIQPFFVENWYFVAGIAMVILGSSLLAYYTWDKHWLLRYTIMPLLLGVFTWSLAGVGRWIEKKGKEFRDTAAILRGAAIGLLPINFMAIALLSADEQVSHKGPTLLGMALLYLLVFGWGLRTWCAAMDRSLSYRLAGPLLLLNALVAVGPFIRTMLGLEGLSLGRCVGAGFYLGFAVTAWTVIQFSRRVLTQEMAREKRIPWFVLGTLALTFVQVFVWAHGYLRHLPLPHTYALLVVLTGWLILYMERRIAELLESPRLHGGESFLGFGMIGLGLFMAFNHETLRIASFVLAGSAWMYQAVARRHSLHYWIALTLWALAVVSVGLLADFPRQWWPALGLGLATGFAIAAWTTSRRDCPELTQACRGMEVVVLFLVAIVAPLVQWHYQSPPLWTAGCLLGASGLFAWRALQDQNVHWLHTTALLLALMLPYAGCMDMVARTAHHNTMIFGLAALSALWLGITRIASNQFLRGARSTVLWFYGVLAVGAMALRVILGDTAPDPLWYRDYMDYAGPILMMLVLVPATYHSRSLGPALMAVAIMAILFPELKANLQRSVPWLSWGSGLGSSCWGLALTGLCFGLRRMTFLKSLGEGDRFLNQELFPLQRRDHTLFTWPIMAAAFFLLLKVDTWHVLRHLPAGPVPIKTAIALGFTAVAWTFIGIYHRDRRAAVIAIYVGWLCALAGIGFGYWRTASQPQWTWPPLLTGLLLQALYWVYRFQLEPALPWVKDLLTHPTRMVLQTGSVALSASCIVSLVRGTPLEVIQYLYCFVGAQLIWHAVAARQPLFSALLFFQIWVGLLSTTAPGTEELWNRLSIARSVTPTLWLLVAVQLGFICLELMRPKTGAQLAPASVPLSTAGFTAFGEEWRALLRPWLLIGTTLTMLLGLAGIMDGVHWLGLSRMQQTLLLVTVLLTARAHGSNFLLLLGMLMAYALVQRDLIAAETDPVAQLRVLATPWSLALFGVLMVALTQGGRWLQQRKPQWVVGAFAESVFAARSCGWLFGTAALLAAFATGYHALDPILRESRLQLCAPYLGAVTFAAVAYFWPRSRYFAGAGFLMLLANLHFVRVFGGTFLREHGLSEVHLVCLGICLSLLQASWLHRRLRSPEAVSVIRLSSLALAGLVLILLSVNYFTEPNLATITSTRFVISGAMAWMAGLYFRRAARHPQSGEEKHAAVWEGVYHFGLVMAIWCAALLVPGFRQPIFTLIALGLPVLYFYLCAELGAKAEWPAARRYGNSAAVLGFVTLGLYLCKGIFQMVLFPGVPISTQHYHYNASLILLLGFVLLRLHALGGTSWLAFYGALAVMLGSYFLLTFLPGLSPFDHPMPGAWCAMVLGHFWIMVGYERSPLRTFLQRLAGLDNAAWSTLARSWSWCLLAATHVACARGLVDYASNTYMAAPLLMGAASVVIHVGIIRRSSLLLLVAAMELVLALHLDFFTPSFLDRAQIIWVLLAIWLALLVSARVFTISLPTVGRIALPLAALVLAHVIYHRPWTGPGLWGMALGAILAAWNPQATKRAATNGQRLCAAALVGVPVWLVYFSQAPFATVGAEAALQAWPVLASTATLLLTSGLARFRATPLEPNERPRTRTRFYLFDAMLDWLGSSGAALHKGILVLALGIVGLTQVTHYQTPFVPREAGLLILLEAALAVGWFYEAKRRPSMPAYYLMEIAALLCCASIRRQIMLTTSFWNYEYDVWASLLISCGLAGAKQVFDLQPRSMRVPLLTLMCLLPVTAVAWVIFRGLGVNMALLVVGLHSVIFAYLGKNERESPYNIAAVAGFVGFILITFYSKLELRAVHAYVIPVGLGILVLQELFQSRIRPETRNAIRLVTLMTMLGSTGYYALADERHAITFNLTMILLCLLAMGLGSFLRIRLYLALGFAGLLVDLISILYKTLVLMERGARMTVIGSMVLIIGAALVFGAIYYKTHHAAFEAWHAKWRRKLGQWE